jgi:hypothetical protein
LNKKGVVTDALILNIRNVGSKGTIYTDYKFIVNGKIYTGVSAKIENFQIGNSIKIVYFPLCPNISESEIHLKQF